ncbi:MAG: hypothetical protein KBT33_07810 [Prevotellaceae bacterium]|nr:hypothetical protein [Candidatus Minthosoma equi]
MKKYRKPICKCAKIDAQALLVNSPCLEKSSDPASHSFSILSNSRESDDEDELDDFAW